MAASAVQLTGVSFSTYSKDEIRQLSVKRIVNPVTFDNMLHPTLGGLYDPALGPIDQKDRCTTCSLLGAHCPGHVGHIELPFPVFNPMFFNRMFALLRATCRYCHTLLVVRPQIQLIRAQLILLDHGLLVQAREMSTLFDRDISSGGGAGEDGEGEEEKAKKRAPSAAQWLDMIKSELETYLTAAGIAPDQLPDFRANSTQVDTYRRELAKQVLALCSGVKKCPSCGGIRRRLTQEHHARIHVLPLNSREREMMAVKGKQELSFIEGYVTPLAEKRPETNGTASDSGSDSESEKEEEEEEEELDTMHFHGKPRMSFMHVSDGGTPRPSISMEDELNFPASLLSRHSREDISTSTNPRPSVSSATLTRLPDTTSGLGVASVLSVPTSPNLALGGKNMIAVAEASESEENRSPNARQLSGSDPRRNLPSVLEETDFVEPTHAEVKEIDAGAVLLDMLSAPDDEQEGGDASETETEGDDEA
eukprot:m.217118 g.217118  ORF g.217118 m.217118 type:complete len:478 (-) comp15596_c5_seq7:23-1456(-)